MGYIKQREQKLSKKRQNYWKCQLHQMRQQQQQKKQKQKQKLQSASIGHNKYYEKNQKDTKYLFYSSKLKNSSSFTYEHKIKIQKIKKTKTKTSLTQKSSIKKTPLIKREFQHKKCKLTSCDYNRFRLTPTTIIAKLPTTNRFAITKRDKNFFVCGFPVIFLLCLAFIAPTTTEATAFLLPTSSSIETGKISRIVNAASRTTHLAALATAGLFAVTASRTAAASKIVIGASYRNTDGRRFLHFDDEITSSDINLYEMQKNDEVLTGQMKNKNMFLPFLENHLNDETAPVSFEQLNDFDDFEPTGEIVSALNPADKQIKTKKGAKKRSVTLGRTTQTIIPNTTITTASTTTTTTTSETTSTITQSNQKETTKPNISLGPLSASLILNGTKNNTIYSKKIATTPNTAAEEKCEPKVLEEVPAEPYYDFTDIAEDAARQFTEFLANKFPTSQQQTITEQIREEVRRRANGIASNALNEDENLLAFAIAAPSIHTVVVKFRDNVTIPPDQVHNKAFLGSYWRELRYAWNSSDGSQEWGSPFRDCNLLKGRWLWPFRISFTEYRIKIVAAAFIAADQDVCNDGLEEIFGKRHSCDRNTTFCLMTESKQYTCICHDSFYLPNTTLQGFRGEDVEMSEGYDNFSCIPCPRGCTNCDQNGVCVFGETTSEMITMENLLRVSVGAILGACILCCIVLSVIVFRQRKSKAIASGMWTVLETILLGIILLYASVAVHFFPASTERCLIEPWLRELGFITCYGAIILKLYRHLVDFRTRKAHRWVLRDIDLLKYLSTMVFAVICYMSAFTASSVDLLETGQLVSLREMVTNTCQPLKWEFVTQTSEILILGFGLHLSIASRNANTQFKERQFLVATVLIEFLISGTYYVLRYIYLPQMSPGVIFLALFLRSQFTNTIALGLIFVPKLWFQHKQVRSLATHDLSIRLPVDAFKDTYDAGQRFGGYAGLCLGDRDLDVGELTIAEMTPEDIRAELKRLYTQLEILKNKTLRQDNPHISKRRGGRKAGHRRFSLQKKGSKDKALSAKHRSNKHHQDVEITEAEPSRTPEDSVCSAEGPTDTYAEISGISHSMLSHSAVSHSIVSHSK